MTSEGGRAQRQLEDSLQEITRRDKKRCAQPKQQVLKDKTNFASFTHCDVAIKLPEAVKVLTIKVKEDQKGPPHMAMYKTKKQDSAELVHRTRHGKSCGLASSFEGDQHGLTRVCNNHNDKC